MPAFKKFGPGDQIDNVLVLEPKYDLVSGSNGWRGSPEGSASLHLYGGARRQAGTGIFQSIEYQSHNPIARQIGNPVRSFPLTSSVNLVWVTDETLNLSERTPTRWGEEHWDTVMRLYQDYVWRDPDYVTASYDYYAVYFQGGSTNIIVDRTINGSNGVPATASFTLESWAKPFTTASAGRDFTLQSMNRSFWFGLTGSTGRLTLSSSFGAVTSSFGPDIRRWNHMAVRFDAATLTGTFYINLEHAGDFALAAVLPDVTSSATMWTVGNRANAFPETTLTSGTSIDSFHGMVGESRYWGYARTWAEISSSHSSRLTGTLATAPIAYLKLNEGPQRLLGTLGSGALDVARLAQGQTHHSATLNGFNRAGPVWLPNDNVGFRPDKTFARADEAIRRFLVLDVPTAFSGRQISPNSLRMECRAHSAATHGLVRVIVDDGRGGLYISGSVCSSSLSDREDYSGVGWNKIGNIFYAEGLAVIKDPSLLDFGRDDGSTAHASDSFQLSFRGTTMVPVKTLMCRVDRGELNASANPTFATIEEDGIRTRSQPSGSLRVTTVGVYNKDRELVAVARLADPVRVRPRDRLNIKLRFDF